MKLINRGVIVIKPKQPFLDWLNQLSNEEDEESYELDDLREDCTTVLIPDLPSLEEMEAFINPLKPDLFEQELANYAEDARDWPDDVTARAFDEWFDLEVHSMVYDAAATPIEIDEGEED